MTVAVGSRLGPYEIVAPIGAGGMGEVYRARDTRLGRDVAIKVLPPEFVSDPGRLRRFEQEARAIAALSHPNILAVFDVGTHGGSPYLVTELLEGESLRDRLEAGGLTVRKAVETAVQIAQGLAAAHDQGIVHRDLKPGNVFITKDGHVKILDFGLAKLAAPKSPAGAAQATTVVEATEVGTTLGTVGYMSPEQVRGEAVDHRSDIFSFGAVLYEMLTGKQAFRRDTPAESMAAILRDDPPDIVGRASVPSPALQGIVRHCLEKKPGERFQSARDIVFDLQAVSGAAVASGRSVVATRRRWWPWLLLGAVLIGVGLGGLGIYLKGERAGRRSAAEVEFRQMSFSPQVIFQAAFAPDGQTIVYSGAFEGNVPELFTIRPEYPEPRPLGLPRAHLLSVSSKGELAILTKPTAFHPYRLFTGTLARVSLGGTAPREVVEGVHQADWSPDGSELAILRIAGGKDRLEFPIGNVLYETSGFLSDLRVSPRGGQIALFEHPVRGDDRGSVIVVDRAGKRSPLPGDYEMASGLAWSRAGDEVLFTASTAGFVKTLYGVDLAGRRRVALRSAGGLTMHDVSRTGRWLVTRDDLRYEISVLAPGASAERDLSWLDWSVFPFLSRDGSMLLFHDESVAAGPNYRVCLRGTDGSPVVSLGEGMAFGLSPDGRWALAIIHTPPQLVVYPTGPGETRRLPRGDLEVYHWACWDQEGRRVLITGNEVGQPPRCYVQDVPDGLPRPLTAEPATRCMVSPDGLRILYLKPDGTWTLQATGGGPAEVVTGLDPNDWVIRLGPEGRSLYLFHTFMPFRFDRLDLSTGRRELIREVAPADRAGVLVGVGWLTDDHRSFAYSYLRTKSQLFAVEGAQ